MNSRFLLTLAPALIGTVAAVSAVAVAAPDTAPARPTPAKTAPPAATTVAPDYPWLTGRKPARTLEQAFSPPAGFHRITLESGSFAAWLRGLPMLPAGSPVLLWNGKAKPQQDLHVAVVDLDVGNQDLQQCADVIIRLRAEYLWATSRQREIGFHQTDGTWLPWLGTGRPAFRNYLRRVFMYAGTTSIARNMKKPPADSPLQPGDVLVQPAHGEWTGHAVLVVDAAEDAQGNRLVLIGHSDRPAQQFHVIPNSTVPELSPWIRTTALQTPGGRVFAREDWRSW